jgi:hypothetical protein
MIWVKRFDGRATPSKLARRRTSHRHRRQRDGRRYRSPTYVGSWCRARECTLSKRGSKRHQRRRDARHA